MTDPNQNYQPWAGPQGPHQQGQQPPNPHAQGGYQQGQYSQGNQAPYSQQDPRLQGQPYQNPQGAAPQGPMGGWNGGVHSAPHDGLTAGMYNATPATQPSTPNGIVFAGIGGALLAIVGSFGPWVSVDGFASMSISGTSGDGRLSLCLAIIGCGMLAMKYWGQNKARSFVLPVAVAAGVLTLLIGIYTLVRLNSLVGDESSLGRLGSLVSVSVGWGLIAVVVGGALLTASSALLLRPKK